jgi:hypothetical protein
LGRGEEAGKQESAGGFPCGFLFSDYLHSKLCRWEVNYGLVSKYSRLDLLSDVGSMKM